MFWFRWRACCPSTAKRKVRVWISNKTSWCYVLIFILFIVCNMRLSNATYLPTTLVQGLRLCCMELWHLVMVVLITRCHNSSQHSLRPSTTHALINAIIELQGQNSSVVECLPKDQKVCGSSLCLCLLWRGALYLHLAPAARISIMLLRLVR